MHDNVADHKIHAPENGQPAQFCKSTDSGQKANKVDYTSHTQLHGTDNKTEHHDISGVVRAKTGDTRYHRPGQQRVVGQSFKAEPGSGQSAPYNRTDTQYQQQPKEQTLSVFDTHYDRNSQKQQAVTTVPDQHGKEQTEKECISYGEIAELQGLAEYIDESDVILREWAGIKEEV